ncbi:agmatinase [Bacteroidota bacterium]
MSTNNLKPNIISLLGVPFDDNSCYMKGAAEAPDKIREALYSGSSNLFSESGIDLSKDSLFTDLGNLELRSKVFFLQEIEQSVAKVLEKKSYVLSLGGDHSITHPIVKAFSGKYDDMTVVHLDAHPDLYDVYDGNRYSNACPFARIMEDKLVTRLIQVGIRTMNTQQREQTERFGVEVFEMKNWQSYKDLTLEGTIYLSLDMDVLDPAFAPGVSHHEPGGLSTRDVIDLIQSLDVQIVGADIVEFNPRRDPIGITSMAAAKLLKEILSKMIMQD